MGDDGESGGNRIKKQIKEWRSNDASRAIDVEVEYLEGIRAAAKECKGHEVDPNGDPMFCRYCGAMKGEEWIEDVRVMRSPPW